MKLFDLWQRIESRGFKGLDADLQTSLMEYSFIAKDLPETKELFIYLINYRGRIDFGWISYKDINEVIDESWFNSKSFFESLGTNKKDWLKSSYIQKIGDLFYHYSPENYGFSMYGEESFLQFARNFKDKGGY